MKGDGKSSKSDLKALIDKMCKGRQGDLRLCIVTGVFPSASVLMVTMPIVASAYSAPSRDMIKLYTVSAFLTSRIALNSISS